ncbi:MAG TPA: hypothetical protein VHG90_12190 [Acidimicrobiales bacterium]|nr:hypothetical protein [Acidimicrobiales bacterium]
MADWPRPPYVDPTGPRADDDGVVRAFLRADVAPHSERLHVEGPVLLADRDVPLVLRLSPTGGGEAGPARAVLVRLDLPEDLLPLRQAVEAVLEAEGLMLLDHDSQLAIAVGVQLVAARMSSWDLWGTDIDDAFADLRAAAVGGTGDVLLGGGAPPVGPDL